MKSLALYGNFENLIKTIKRQLIVTYLKIPREMSCSLFLEVALGCGLKMELFLQLLKDAYNQAYNQVLQS